MKIKKLNIYPFRLPFASAFTTGRGALAGREGLILEVESDSGLVGLGEAAPLPEFGGGRLPDVLNLLEPRLPTLQNIQLDDLTVVIRQLLDRPGPGTAALANALDTAYCDLQAQAANLPIATWLNQAKIATPRMKEKPLSPKSPHPKGGKIPVNATIGTADTSAALNAVQQALEQGFNYVKLKAGVKPTSEEELARIRAVNALVKQAGGQLRLDANGAWSVAQAIEILTALEDLDLELVEQPVAAEDLAGLAEVRRAVRVKIAADEPVTGLAAARQVIEAGAADTLVIKPMVVGGLRAGRQIYELARLAGLNAFVTTTIDSGVGIAAALHLAASLPGPLPACGLATAPLLAGTLVKNLPVVEQGFMQLPAGPGLGVELDPAQLEQFAY